MDVLNLNVMTSIIVSIRKTILNGDDLSINDFRGFDIFRKHMNFKCL
jgi:hypothetical protein